MFVRILALVLLLASPLLAAVDVDTFRTAAAVDDALVVDTINITRPEAYRNYGGITVASLHEKSSKLKRFLTRPNPDSLAYEVPSGREVISAKYHFRTDFAPPTGTITFYQVLQDWEEGVGIGDVYSYMGGGVTWITRNSPTKPDTMSGTLPSSINWNDSGMVTRARDQYSCGSCWSFASIAAFESAYLMEIYTGGTETENAEDGTGADRTAQAIVIDDDTSVTVVSATGWKIFKVPTDLVDDWYHTSGMDNGLVFVSDTGDFTIGTTEASGLVAPRLFMTVTVRNSAGNFEDKTIQIKGTTQLLDSYINPNATSTNYGSADSAKIKFLYSYFLRMDSTRKVINDVFLPAGDTFYSTVSAYCSLYVTPYHTGIIWEQKAMKAHWVEGEITYNQWKSGYEWGRAGATRFDEVNFSEQQSLDCIDGLDCTNGGYMDMPLNYFMQTGDSVYAEGLYPYNSSVDNACKGEVAPHESIIKWYHYYRITEARHLKQMVLHKPIPITIINHQSSPQFWGYTYSAGNKCFYNDSTELAKHAVLLVGYDDNFTCDAGEGTGAWIVKNSSGSNWGDGGIGYIAYNSNNDILELADSGDPPYLIDLINSPDLWTSNGLGFGTDISSTAVASVYTDGSSDTWYSVDIPVSLVQGWVNGTVPNYGLYAISNVTGNFPLTWSTSDAASNQAFWEITSATTVKIGNAKIGNSSIGR